MDTTSNYSTPSLQPPSTSSTNSPRKCQKEIIMILSYKCQENGRKEKMALVKKDGGTVQYNGFSFLPTPKGNMAHRAIETQPGTKCNTPSS